MASSTLHWYVYAHAHTHIYTNKHIHTRTHTHIHWHTYDRHDSRQRETHIYTHKYTYMCDILAHKYLFTDTIQDTGARSEWPAAPFADTFTNAQTHTHRLTNIIQTWFKTKGHVQNGQQHPSPHLIPSPTLLMVCVCVCVCECVCVCFSVCVC